MLKTISLSLIAYITVLLNLFKETLPVGIIEADVSLPISNTLANENQYADYTFRFNITTKLVKGGYVQVIFPSQFESGLGIPLLPECSVTCERIERTVNFYFDFDLFPTLIYNMTIKGIKNPDSTGGTGQFIFKTKRGDNVLDESFIMGILGVGGGISELTSTTVAVDSTDGAKAGEVGKYVFSFKSNIFLYPNIYAKFYLPKGSFEVGSNPSCSSFEINGALVKGTFKCTYSKEFDTIEVRGFEEPIKVGGEVGISVTMRNPQYSFTTKTFDIFLFKEGTTAAYARKLNVQGVPIVAGSISQISLLPVDSFFIPSKRKLMWYRLSFKLTNPINEGSMIEIKIPDSMVLRTYNVLGQPSSFYAESGLTDKSNENPMIFNYYDNAGSRYIRLENYAAQSQPDNIAVVMLLELPNSNGLSLPFEIRSFTSITAENEIDNDLSTARIEVLDIPSPVSHSLASSVTVADGTSYTDLTFNIEPSKNIPGGGQFKLLIDQRLETQGVDNSNCQVWAKNVALFKNSPSCTKRDRDIYITLTDQSYSLGVTSQMQLNQIIQSPELAGIYFIEVQTLDASGNLLESYTEELIFTATPLTNYQVFPFPKWRYEISMHEITFDTPYKIPAAKVQLAATDLVSFIQIEYFNSNPTYIKNDLGMGYSIETRIPCKSIRGLTPITGFNVNCTLIPGSTPTIRITNYQEVQAGANILIYLPNVENPRGNWDLTTKLVTKQNRLYSVISSATLTFSSASNSQTGLVANIPFATGFYSLSNNIVSTDFNLNNLVSYADTLPPETRILFKFPKYDVGFVPEEGHVTCRVDNMAFNCYQFNGLDWVYGQLASYQTMNLISTATQKSVLYISNLRWPRYKPTVAITTNFVMEIYRPDFRYRKIVNYPVFDLVNSNGFHSITLNVDKKRQKEVDATYTFTFVPKNDIPAGGTVILTLDQVFNLIASFPRVTISYPEFQDLNENVKVNHFYTSRIITINNMDEHPEGVPFRIIISGVRNPEVTGPITGFDIVTQLQGNIINEQSNFVSMELGALFTPGVILSNAIDVFPTNNLVFAEYTFKFTPQTKLSVGSQIHIVFPTDYTNLPQSPDCSIDGGLQTFESCLKLANEIIIKLDTAYITDQIILKIKGIQNPNVAKTQSFEIYSFYDGSIVDETGSSTSTQRQVTLSEPASLVNMREFYFDPVNEGEIANYVISFLPTNNIGTDMNIYIKFPDSFDQRLGKNVEIQITDGLEGDIKTTIKDRMIEISNFDAYTVNPTNPIKLEVIGAINPNKPLVGHSGYVSVGVLKIGTKKYVDFLEQAAIVETVSSAGWLVLHNITTSSTYSRLPGIYTFNMTINEAVPKTSFFGKIYVDLPIQYELGSGFLKCKNQTANLGNNIRCNLDKRTIALSGHTKALTSNVGFYIEGIDNPLDEIKSHTMFVRTYNGFNREIIQRSFENLDPFDFTFSFPGPLIIVNEDKTIYVERGTQTRDLYIECSEIMALNLTFIPSTPGFSFIPDPLEIKVGQKRIKFRVSVPMGFPDGEYYVNWVTRGDQTPNIYTPVKKTRVIITKQTNVPIVIKEINDIPLGGNSLPVIFSTEYAPDTGVEILARLDQNYPGIALSTPTVSFLQGINSNSFTVYFTDKNIQSTATVQSGIVHLELIGVNKDVYALPKFKLKFNIKSKDNLPPEITDIQVVNVTQQRVEFQFSCSDISTAYVMLALRGTVQPTWQELKAQGPPEYETTNSIYQIIEVGNELEAFGSFNGLEAEHEYVIYVFLEDRGEGQISAPGYVEFNTTERYNAAFVDLRFRQTYINSAERQLIAERVAFLLSLAPEKVEEKKYDFSVTVGPTRILQDSEELDDLTSKLTLTILAEPTNEVYPTPYDLALLLNRDDKKVKMSETFSNFDSDFTIAPYNFTRYEIGFSAVPKITGVNSNTVNITANLDNFGFIYAVALAKSEDLGRPSPFQIANGLDYKNVPIPSGKIEVNQKFVLFDFSVKNLDPDTDYNLYMTAGSAHPGYPDYMKESSTIFLEFKTDKAPIIPKLSLEYSNLLKVYFTLFGSMIFFIW